MGIARAVGDVTAAGINAAATLGAAGITSGVNAKIAKETNAANIQMTQETNAANRAMAAEANALNYQMFNEQNDWNLQRRNEEWAYNDPSAQMQRYLQAGINPLWAMSGSASAGQAQQLTSAQSAPAVTSTDIAPHADAYSITPPNLDVAGTNIVNSIQSARDFLLKKKQTESEIKRTTAETALIESQTESNEFANQVNLATYDTIVSQREEDLRQTRYTIRNLQEQEKLTKKQQRLLDESVKKEKALTAQIEAGTRKTETETLDIIDNMRRQWTALKIQQQQANAATTQANASVMQANAALANAATSSQALSHQIEKDQKEFELKSNEQILDIIDKQRGTIDKLLGSPNNFFNTLIGHRDNSLVDRTLNMLQAASTTLYQRYYANPTDANLQAIKAMQNKIKDFQNLQVPLQTFDRTPNQSPSVQNPVYPSDKW